MSNAGWLEAHIADPRPFAGLKVADLSWVVAGPTVGRVLADYGATVVRVESSQRVETARVVGPYQGGVPGPENSTLYGTNNAGKLGLTLDLSREEGRDVARDLVRWCDALVEAFAPGVMQRWGLDYAALRAIKPDLVMLSTSLMGQAGPYATYAGYGHAGAALSGFQNLVGWPDRAPIGPFGPYTDYVGPRYSLVALLAALDHHRRTGEGCHIDHSQAESGINFLASAFIDHAVTGRVAGATGNRDPQLAPHGVYPCRPPEGRAEAWVAIAVPDDAAWSRLAMLIGGDALVGDERFCTLAQRKAHEDALDAIVAAWTAERDAAEVERRLQAQGIPAHAVQVSADLVHDPQLLHRGHFVHLEHPLHGSTVVEASRYLLSETPARTERAAPTFGRDNERVLREILGYSEDRVAALNDAGVLR